MPPWISSPLSPLPDGGRGSLHAGGIVLLRLAVPHAPDVGWLYVLDPDLGDDWHLVRDLGLMLSRAAARAVSSRRASTAGLP
jgi:hypothetical protein